MLGVIKRSISDVGAAPPISPVPIFCGTRSLTAPVLGSTSATTSMRRSRPMTQGRHTWMLSTQRTRPSRPIQSGCRIRCSGAFLSDGFVDREMESSSRLFSGMAGSTRKGPPLQRAVPRDEDAFGVFRRGRYRALWHSSTCPRTEL